MTTNDSLWYFYKITKRQRKTKTNKQTNKQTDKEKNNTHTVKEGGGGSTTNVRLRITVFGTFTK